MGQMEETSKKRSQRANVQRIVLRSILAAGVLSAAAVAPTVLMAMAQLGLKPGRRQNEVIRRAQERLIKRGLLEWNKKGLRLTPKGERQLRLSGTAMLPIRYPHRWDKKWRMLIFDIPEKKRSKREQIRYILRANGFLCVQGSVWVHPYDCEDAIALLKSDLHIGKELLYVIVDAIENDAQYRSHFKLPLETVR